MVDRCRMAAVQHRDVEWGQRLRGHQYDKESKAELVDQQPVARTPMQEQLPAGDYKVEWHAVSDDTHRVKGNYSFSVVR
jgi:methionine-rich copper-binding protein CopC